MSYEIDRLYYILTEKLSVFRMQFKSLDSGPVRDSRSRTLDAANLATRKDSKSRFCSDAIEASSSEMAFKCLYTTLVQKS